MWEKILHILRILYRLFTGFIKLITFHILIYSYSKTCSKYTARLGRCDRTSASRSCDFVITGLTSDQIALHSVQLPLLIIKYWLVINVCLLLGTKYNEMRFETFKISASLRHGSENWILPPAITLQVRCVCVDYSWILRDGFECLLVKIQKYRNLFIFGIILLMFFCNINGFIQIIFFVDIIIF